MSEIVSSLDLPWVNPKTYFKYEELLNNIMIEKSKSAIEDATHLRSGYPEVLGIVLQRHWPSWGLHMGV